MPVTTVQVEDAVPRDGAQAASADFALKVQEAEAAIRAYVAERPGESWSLRELREAITGGRSSSVITTAFFNLEDSGELRIDYVTSTVSAQV